jgi:hypothetical protein
VTLRLSRHPKAQLDAGPATARRLVENANRPAEPG